MLRLRLWDISDSSLNPPTRWSSSLYDGKQMRTNKEHLDKSGTFFVCFWVLYLPSLLTSLSDVTAFTRSGTSVQVLEPSQWARQTAPLPNKVQIMADIKNAIPDCTRRQTEAKRINLNKRMFTGVSQHNQMAGGGIIRSKYWHTAYNRQSKQAYVTIMIMDG